MVGRLYDGKAWTDINEIEGGNTGNQAPLAPILNGDGKIFVSIPSYRDGKRCGETIVDLFSKAKDPDSIIVGIIDQSSEDDSYCLEAYCKELGYEIFKKASIRQDTTKVMTTPERKDCPRVDQIRKLSIHHYGAKGPTFARSLARKILGNEEFCLQIDAHMKFVQDWDEKVKQEWSATRNEYGIISTVPHGFFDMEHTPVTTVSRSCSLDFMPVGIPHYDEKGDGKVENLEKPLLSHAWSSGFSFAKCHLEESAPYDPFTPYVMGVENFARFARFWTRGYDVYTPTQNIVYHNRQPNPDGHDIKEWNRPRYQRFRDNSLKRIRTYLGVPGGLEDFNVANLGIYGLGKRRSLKQLESFLDIEMETMKSRPKEASCTGFQWVPYDVNISPGENLFDAPDDLDAQPEYPLRTELTFYKEEVEVEENHNLDGLGDVMKTSPKAVLPSISVLLPLWILGLIIWYMTFAASDSTSRRARMRKKKKAMSQKDV